MTHDRVFDVRGRQHRVAIYQGKTPQQFVESLRKK